MLGRIFSGSESDMRPLFIVGTGRCGTHLMYELFSSLKISIAHHILDLDADSFYRYFKWNNIPVDLAGFYSARDQIMHTNGKKLYVESNPYLSFHIPEIYDKYNARIIFLIRNAEDVVRSHITKGWYENDYKLDKTNLPIGYQYGMKTNHFLGRIVPQGEEYDKWQSLTRVGKISWMWQRVNLWIQKDFEQLPESDKYFLKVEELDLYNFKNILEHFNIRANMPQKQFDKILNSRPGKSNNNKKKEITLSALEYEEFQNETSKARALFGY